MRNGFTRVISVLFTCYYIILLIACGTKNSVQYPSWEEQVDYASQAAFAIDENAIPTGVRAYPERLTDLDGPLIITFVFSRPNGRHTEVTFQEDMVRFAPTVVPENGGPSIDVQSVGSRQALLQSFEAVNIGPREAIQVSLATGQEFSVAQNKPVNPSVALWTQEEVTQLLGVSAIWVVTYYAGGQELYVSIDAHTGKLLNTGSDITSLFPGLHISE